MPAVQLFLAFIVALSITAVLIPLLERWAPIVGLTDRPGPRKVHATPVPRVGGIAMACGMLAPLLLAAEPGPSLTGLLLGIVVLLVFGVWDDRVELGYRAKFAGQILAVVLCVFVGDIRIESITLDARYPLPEPLSAVLTVVFLIGVTNAVNLSDGLDGLAGGMALLCSCAIALLAAAAGGVLVVTVALISAGAILGFLRFNTHPARIFMGDSGSQVLGFTMGALAILLTQGDRTAMSAALPLLLIGMPILDTLSVMGRRIREGRSPFAADRSHLHHRLLALGFRHSEAVAIVYLLQCGLFLIAWFLRFESDLLIVGTFLLFSLAVLGTMHVATVSQWRARSDSQRSLIARAGDAIRAAAPAASVVRFADLTKVAALGAYVAGVLVAAQTIGRDVALLCLVLLGAMLLATTIRAHRSRGWIDRVVTYVTALLVIYVDQTGGGAPWFSGQSWLLLGIAAASAVISVLFSGRRGFQATALDFLVIFIAIVVPHLAGTERIPASFASGTAKAVVLLYVVEMSLGAPADRRLSRSALILVSLLAVAARAVFVSQA